MHREDGPAIELPNGYQAWYYNGQRSTAEEMAALMKGRQLEAQVERLRMLESEAAVMTKGVSHGMVPMRPIRFKR